MNMGERLFWTGEERWTWQRRLLLLIPTLLTLLPVVLGLAIVWRQMDLIDFSDPLLLGYVLLILVLFVLPFCLPLIAAEAVLWFSTLYVCKVERRTKVKTMLYCIASPLALTVVARYVWAAFELLR